MDIMCHYRERVEQVRSALIQEIKSAEVSEYEMLKVASRKERWYRDIQDCVSYHAGKWTALVVVGIGGSTMGTAALYKAIKHTSFVRLPPFIMVDTFDQDELQDRLCELECLLQQGHVPLVCVISKSGTTFETHINTLILFEKLCGRTSGAPLLWLALSEQGSPLYVAAQEQGMYAFAWEPRLGGRYSVCSPTTLLPLALLGLPIERIVEVSHHELEHYVQGDGAVVDRSVRGLVAWDAGYYVEDVFAVRGCLTGYAFWYRQLLAESLGKQKIDAQGGTERYGVLPTISYMTKDLHSMFQLYLAGPHIRTTRFLTLSCHHELSTQLNVSTSLPSLGEAEHRILSAVIRAYTDAQLPFTVDTVSCALEGGMLESVARLMQQDILHVITMARVWGINPFDEPDIVRYKKHMQL